MANENPSEQGTVIDKLTEIKDKTMKKLNEAFSFMKGWWSGFVDRFGLKTILAALGIICVLTLIIVFVRTRGNASALKLSRDLPCVGCGPPSKTSSTFSWGILAALVSVVVAAEITVP